METYRLTLDWLTGGRLDSRGLLTHTFPLKSYREAMDVSLNKSRHRAVKVALDFRETAGLRAADEENHA